MCFGNLTYHCHHGTCVIGSLSATGPLLLVQGVGATYSELGLSRVGMPGAMMGHRPPPRHDVEIWFLNHVYLESTRSRYLKMFVVVLRWRGLFRVRVDRRTVGSVRSVVDVDIFVKVAFPTVKGTLSQ
jgi:hypothetical protein